MSSLRNMPVAHPRIWFFCRVEACLEGGNDGFERGVNVNITIKPTNGACETDGSVNGFGVSDVADDPGYAARVVRVPFPKACGVPHRHKESIPRSQHM